ncbi:hypothetical protein REPUB_Repub20aG0120500 [Reevesia pubescens]
MGCGESKHVATENTISRKNSRTGSKRGETSETIEETSKLVNNTSSILVQKEGKNVNQDSGEDNSRGVADGKGLADITELKKEKNVENEKENKAGVLRENEIPIDGIAFEGLSGRSEYYSPREEAAKESLLDENVKPADVLEDKKLAQETKIETKETKEETVQEIIAEETKEDTLEDKKLAEDVKEETVKDQKLAEEKKEETANGEPETVKEEENLVKETETAETIEAKVSTPDEKKEEKPAGSPAEYLKTE